MSPDKINKRLPQKFETIESDNKVRILYACESGSRVWGFDSEDSDYDIRFLYVHPEEWYLSIDVENRYDTIQTRDGSLDIVGWDIRKALHLMYKSNPPLWEWLNSPIVYQNWPMEYLKTPLWALEERCYSPTACFYHYFHMAKNNWKKYLLGKETVILKKYLYVLRPLLACGWILNSPYEPVPAQFDVLCNTFFLKSTKLRQIIQKLVDDKRLGMELGEAVPIPELNEFLEQEFAVLEKRMEYNLFPKESLVSPKDALNRFFRLVVHSAWNVEPEW